MSFKTFLISIIKNIIIILLATLIFSSITLDFPNLIKGVFGDIFAYASPDVQKQVVSKLAETCSSLDQGKNLLTINQICINRSLLDSMKENCENYRELKRRNVKIENEAQVTETCQQIESGEIEEACNQLNDKSSLLPDLNSIGALCKDYKAGKINDKEFFFSVISGTIPSNIAMPNIGALEKYNQAVNYLNNNKILYFVVLAVLMVLLYLLIMDIKLFIVALTNISFSIGILIMLPYFAILAYDKFVGIDTTSLLSSMFGEGFGIGPRAIISVILLLFLRTYNSFIIILGIVFLVIGIIGKVYNWRLGKQSKTPETKKSEKASEKLRKEEKESSKEDRERKKSTKEILDELEEMHKKKTKKD